MLANLHKLRGRKLLISRVLIIWKPAKTFVAVRIQKKMKTQALVVTQEPKPHEDSRPRAL